MTHIETLTDLRKRCREWDGIAGRYRRNLIGDISLVLGLVPNGYNQREEDKFWNMIIVRRWSSRLLLTSLDAIDAATRKLAPGWGIVSINENNKVFSVQLYGGKSVIYGIGPTEARARLDALLSVLIFEAQEKEPTWP